MFKFIIIFLYLSLCTMADLFSKGQAPTPQQSFSVFRSIDIDYEKQLVYHEVIPIITTGNTQESFDFRPFILENKITGEIFFQIQLSYYTNKATTIATRKKRRNDEQTNIIIPELIKSFDPLSIAFMSSDENRDNAKFLPIVKPSLQSSDTKDLRTSYIGVIYLFPDDVTNLIISLTKDPLTTIPLMPFPSSGSTLSPIIQASNPSTPFNLFSSSKELYITLKNNQEEKIILSFSPDNTAILKIALDFYTRLLQSTGKPF